MAGLINELAPVAQLPLGLGRLRKTEAAAVSDAIRPPGPRHVRSCGRGVEALVRAMLDGEHALYQVGRRLEARGMVALLQPGLTPAARNDDRVGHLLAARFAANRNGVFSRVALKAVEVSGLPTPWRPQDTTTSAR
jgi:hypothetical protein